MFLKEFLEKVDFEKHQQTTKNMRNYQACKEFINQSHALVFSYLDHRDVLFQLNVYCEDRLINGCPASFKVLADRSKVSFTRVERCTVGHLTELQVSIYND